MIEVENILFFLIKLVYKESPLFDMVSWYIVGCCLDVVMPISSLPLCTSLNKKETEPSKGETGTCNKPCKVVEARSNRKQSKTPLFSPLDVTCGTKCVYMSDKL